MIKRRGARLSTLILSDHHRHHRRNWHYCLMAAPSYNDQLIFLSTKSNFNSKASSTGRFQFLPLERLSLSSSSSSSSSFGMQLINGRCTNGLKGRCFSDCREQSADNSNDNKTNSYWHNDLHKARFFAPWLPHLLRNSSEIGLEEDNRDAKSFNKGGHSGTDHNGSSLGPEKLIVAVDIDEVLGNFISALNRFIADQYSLNHSVSEYHVYEFFKIWNCSRDEADIRVHEFFKTSYFKTGIHPIPGARQALQKLSRFCNLSVVTSRQNAIKDHTIGWIEKHYPGLFQEIHFGNHFALDGQSRPKSDICRSLGTKVLIDDNPRYAIECAEVGIRVLLFDYENSYPWCKKEYATQHPLVTKVHNWEEVEHQLVSRIVS